MFTIVESSDAIKEESARMKSTSFCSRALRASGNSIEDHPPYTADIGLGTYPREKPSGAKGKPSGKA